MQIRAILIMPHNYLFRITVLVFVFRCSFDTFWCVIYKQDPTLSFILLLLRSNRNSFSTHRPYELDESCALFGNAHFDVLKKTVLYIHNYLEGPNHESVNVIVDSYLQRNDHNILVLDWSQLSNGNYLIDAVPNAKQVLL